VGAFNGRVEDNLSLWELHFEKRPCLNSKRQSDSQNKVRWVVKNCVWTLDNECLDLVGDEKVDRWCVGSRRDPFKGGFDHFNLEREWDRSRLGRIFKAYDLYRVSAGSCTRTKHKCHVLKLVCIDVGESTRRTNKLIKTVENPDLRSSRIQA